MNLVTKIIYKRQNSKIKFIKKVYTKILYLLGCDIPINVVVGNNVFFCHNCLGSVLYDGTIIEDNVRIYQNVTIGLNNPFQEKITRILVKDGAIICAGAKLLCKDELIIGKNSIVGANCVLNHSIGDNEIWVGNPARRVGFNKGE